MKSEASENSNQSEIEIKIDELVLTGFYNKDRAMINHSFRTELEKLFSNNKNLFNNSISLNKINSDIRISDNNKSDEIGRRAANSLYEELLNKTQNNSGI